MKDYKKPPFSKSRKVNPIVKPLPSTLASSTMTLGTSVHPFQSSTSAYSPSACDESTLGPQLPEHSWRPDLAGFDPSSSSQIPPLRSAVSYTSKFSSVSLMQRNARSTPVHDPGLCSNNYLNEAPEKLTTYDQNYAPGGPGSLVRTQPVTSDIQRDTVQNVDHDMTPTIFGGRSARISSELPTASHQEDHPCFVSDLPKTTSPSQPRTPQPSDSQTPGRAVLLPATGVKRRLGMGRTTGGYSNKKFKPPTWRVCNS